jgi:hypothetical protein
VIVARQTLVRRVREALRHETVLPAGEYVYRSPEERRALAASAFGDERPGERRD